MTIDLELAGMMATRAHDTTVMAELSVQGRRNEALDLGVLPPEFGLMATRATLVASTTVEL